MRIQTRCMFDKMTAQAHALSPATVVGSLAIVEFAPAAAMALVQRARRSGCVMNNAGGNSATCFVSMARNTLLARNH